MVFTLGNISFIRPLRKTQLNLFIGGGWGSFRSVAKYNDQRLYIGGDYYLDHYLGNGTPNPNLGKDVRETYDGRHWIVPFGFGVKHNLGRLFDIGADYRQTYLRSDNIDVYNTAIWQNRWFDQYALITVYAALKLGNIDPRHVDWINPVEDIYKRLDSVETKMDFCMHDSDADGVSDCFDVDNHTLANCKVYGNGKAVDTDCDGVPDCVDPQPTGICGCEHYKDGIMVDEDDDNVPDCIDRCMGTPKSAAVDAKGCEIPTKCCGCEDVVFPSLYFDANKCNIKPEYQVVLSLIADKMKMCPDLKLSICASKVVEKNKSMVVNTCRCDMIKEVLKKYGIAEQRIVCLGPDQCKSSDPNKVEFKVTKKP
jgi:hypothetical protein